MGHTAHAERSCVLTCLSHARLTHFPFQRSTIPNQGSPPRPLSQCDDAITVKNMATSKLTEGVDVGEGTGVVLAVQLPRHCEVGGQAKEVLRVIDAAILLAWKAAHIPLAASTRVRLSAARVSRIVT